MVLSSPTLKDIFPQAGNKPVSDGIVEIIQERACGIQNPIVFGTAEDVYKVGRESLLPSYFKPPLPQEMPRIKVGGPHCRQPYEASLYNCSALSYGPLSRKSILALNQGANRGKFYQNTGEVGISPYHFGLDLDVDSPAFDMKIFLDEIIKKNFMDIGQAGDIVWEIGTGYYGCRQADGLFDSVEFSRRANLTNVKMIEIKLSQGVEPCKALPMKELTHGVAQITGVELNEKVALPPFHTAFSTPIELLFFIQTLRQLSNGKPIGIKLALGQKHEFLAICKAMLKTEIMPDFITVDGMEGATSGSPQGVMGYTGTPLNDALIFIHNALVGVKLREHIRLIATGKIFTEKCIISKLARGADICATARGMLIAMGCDQQRECYKGTCRKGIATQDDFLMSQFDTFENAERVFNFHKITLLEFSELLSIAGLTHPSQLQARHVQKRISEVEAKGLDEIYEFTEPGSLLTWKKWKLPQSFKRHWCHANPSQPFCLSSQQKM